MDDDLTIPPFLRRTRKDDLGRDVTTWKEPPKTQTNSDAYYEKRKAEISVANEADKRWRNWMPTADCPTRPRKATFAKQVRAEQLAANRAALDKVAEADGTPSPSLQTASRGRRADRVIRLKVAANPRARASKAWKYFEAMKGSPTVGEYLAKFDDKKKASQELWNICHDGYGELLG